MSSCSGYTYIAEYIPTYNVVGIPIAAGILFPVFGWLLNPIVAGEAIAFSSASVVTNALRLRNFQPKTTS